MSISGDDMAARIVEELPRRGRLSHTDSLQVDHDRRVVANILGRCLRQAYREAMSVGPIAATLDEIDLAPSLAAAPPMTEPFEED